MSVLNQSGDELVECPLCMEPLEVDDLNFFPCTCGYQICRFCWHRIRTDENGLCPACRKAYPEDPADFKPLTREEVSRLKAEKRHRDMQRKQKVTESRKHLANVRVVQNNLVFVVGLPMRLADAEMLKKHEYFGKFGKIHKVVINQSTTYAGSQGPSASAYVTYQRSEDALRAIQAVNNISVDGRTLKTSLGTTKYCSHFLKNQTCPKADCMYLHEMGDPGASFTKEEMQAGKHQEYERKLHDTLINNTNNRKPTPSPPTVQNGGNSGGRESGNSTSGGGGGGQASNVSKEAWPSLNNHSSSQVIVGVADQAPTSNNNKGEHHNKKHPHSKHKHRSVSESSNQDRERSKQNGGGSKEGSVRISPVDSGASGDGDSAGGASSDCDSGVAPLDRPLRPSPHHSGGSSTAARAASFLEDNNSFFSSHSFTKAGAGPGSQTEQRDWAALDDTLQVHSSEDWQAAFGFAALHQPAPPPIPAPPIESQAPRDDDLGFDPFHETQKALAEMIEKEEQNVHLHPKGNMLNHNNRLNACSSLLSSLRLGRVGQQTPPPPPGFSSAPVSHMNAFGLGIPRTGSKILPYFPPAFAFHSHQPQPSVNGMVWDWSRLDPAIVSVSNQHCDLGPPPPPPGFNRHQATLDNM